MSEEQVRERLRQIDLAHSALTGQLDAAPAEFQDSRQGDDDATEYESLDQKLGRIRGQLMDLERERDALHRRLESFQKAA